MDAAVIIVSVICLISISISVIYIYSTSTTPTTTTTITTTTKIPTTPTPTLYPGDNGSVNGNTYCSGGWGNPTGQNKNMTCVSGIDNASGNTVTCSQGLGAGNFSFYCQ